MEDYRIIYMNPKSNRLAVFAPLPGVASDEAAKTVVPSGVAFEVVAPTDIPSDRTFRNAWFHDTTEAPQKVGVDVTRARDIAHERRRIRRTAEFYPLDVESTIPEKASQAEAARQSVRDKYAMLQEKINAASTPDEIKSIISAYDL